MRQQLNTQPESEASLTSAPALDSPEVLFLEYQQLTSKISEIEYRKKQLAAEIKERLGAGEQFGDGRQELYLCPVKRQGFDWERLVADKVLTEAQVASYMKPVSVEYSLKWRKVEKQSPQDDELRERLSRSLKGA